MSKERKVLIVEDDIGVACSPSMVHKNFKHSIELAHTVFEGFL